MQFKTETAVGLFIIAALAAFFCMTLKTGVFRFDKNHYVSYNALFKDVTGLVKKSEVKIAGVKVGWVESIELTDRAKKVSTQLMILKDFVLHSDAYAVVRQESLLGAKYLEVVPGNPDTPKLEVGGTLAVNAKEVPTLEDILSTFKNIANNFESVTDSFKDSLAGSNKDQLKVTVSAISKAAEKIAAITESLDKLMVNNESNLDHVISDISQVMHELKDRLPMITENIVRVTQQLNDQLPRFADSTNTVAQEIKETSASLKKVIKDVGQIGEKINGGQGVLGKMLNDDESYDNIKSTVSCVRNTIETIQNIMVILDGHTESLFDNSCMKDFKGYFNLRVFPCPKYFFLTGLAFSQKGYISRRITYCREFDEKTHEITKNLFTRREVINEKRDNFRLNLQIGTIYNHFALRAGLIEGTFGFGLDCDMPFMPDRFKWISTLEAFDFKGFARLSDDSRPHLKWFNKMYFSTNVYLTFGIDDFISKHNRNAFVGLGLRFGYDNSGCFGC